MIGRGGEGTQVKGGVGGKVEDETRVRGWTSTRENVPASAMDVLVTYAHSPPLPLVVLVLILCRWLDLVVLVDVRTAAPLHTSWGSMSAEALRERDTGAVETVEGALWRGPLAGWGEAGVGLGCCCRSVRARLRTVGEAEVRRG